MMKQGLDQITAMEETLTKLEKAELLLTHWTQEYGFSKKPDPKAAVDWGQSKGGAQTKEQSDSVKWYWEYNLIFNLVDIAFDYVRGSQKMLEDAIAEWKEEHGEQSIGN
ncbi:hypothetical protein [Desulfitobacterium hafniense]|nr:hypothetical protein [Desulfitobacterium hafniense]